MSSHGVRVRYEVDAVTSRGDLHPKPEGYYSCTRSELIPLVPRDATRILELGCGEGGFARSLRVARPASRLEIVGIELNEAAALVAQTSLDEVLVGDAERLVLPYENHFDCVILADVLEHLVDPWKMMRRIRELLRQGGSIIVSIPNVQHWSVLVNLLRGRWDYTDYGIMDNTHLRFFTAKSISTLVNSAGFQICRMNPLLGQTTRSKIARLSTGGLAVPFLARQYVIVAQRCN